MIDYIKTIKEERLKEKKVHVFEGLTISFLDNEYESDDYNDDDRTYLIMKLLQSFKDTTFGGFFNEDDFRVITHFFTDKYHAKNQEAKLKKEEREKVLSKWDSLGFLDDLKGHVKEDITQLYMSEATPLLNESTDAGSSGSFETVTFPIVRGVSSKLLANDKSTLANHWVVYMVECSDGTLYTGISNNLSKRILDHNGGNGAKYTRSRLPVVLRWLEFYNNRSEASKYEYKIKKLSRKQKLKLIKEYEKFNML